MAEEVAGAPGPAELVHLPTGASPVEIALDQLDVIYAFIYARVGNRTDAEDLTQQVALKALPRLRSDVSPAAIRAYLFATARSALATFWSRHFELPEDELPEHLAWVTTRPQEQGDTLVRVNRVLDGLPVNYRRVLELRFLRGYSLREVAREIGTTTGNVKVLQLRALRAAAKAGFDG